MRWFTLVWIAVVLLVGCLLGCGGAGSQVKKKPYLGTPVRTGDPVSPEETLALGYLKAHRSPTIEILQWGPHDMDGFLAGEVEKRREKGWTEFHHDVLNVLVPGVKLLRVRYRYIDGRPAVGDDLMFFKDGQPFPVARYESDKEEDKKPIYRDYFTGNEEASRDWIASAMRHITQWEKMK